MRTVRGIFTVAVIAAMGLTGCGSSSTNTVSSTDTMYVAARASHGVWGYYADFNIGSLTTINGSPFSTQQAPTAIAINPAHTFGYVANASSSTVTSYSFDLNGSMTPNGTQVVGSNPVALAIDSGGKFLFVTNQNSGSLSVFSIGPNGGLSTVQPAVPLPNLACPTPGLLPCPAPVALAVTPSTSFLYVIDQLQNLVFTFPINLNSGALSLNANLPALPVGSAPSGMAMNSAGTLLYVANRDSETVSGFTIAADNSTSPGNLTAIPGSFATELSPVAAAVDPSGQFLYVADRSSNQVSGFRIKAVIGTLSALSNSPYNSGPAPDFIAISPTNKFLYVSNSGNSSISAYMIDPTTGNLIPASGAVPTGAQPAGIAFGR
ncbi:MAG: beta-propeller fold lactonase family protein [Acidobacteria bacterium]|nr:beta-propeller fold lactonase family protein [Acidobacteriota bacterium]